MAVVKSSPGMAEALRNMCRKRLFKKAVKQFSLDKNRGLSDDDIVAAFHDADMDNSGMSFSVSAEAAAFSATSHRFLSLMVQKVL